MPSTLVFDYPNVVALLNYLTQQLLADNSEVGIMPTQDQTPPESEATELLSGDELSNLMDEKLADIEKLLGEGDAS